MPANVFGPKFKSQSVSVKYYDLVGVYKTAKGTGIVYLQLDKEEIPVLVKNIQLHPVSDKILHVDFRKVDLQEKITTAVPVKTVGTSSAVTQLGGVLLLQADRLTVEALPQDIPQAIEVNISQITEIGQEVTVANIGKSNQYVIKDDGKKVVVSVIAHKEESTVAETTAATPEVITTKEEEAAAETAVTPAAAETKKPATPEAKKPAPEKTEKPK